MPYVFEATFTQPILAQLDNGTIKGAKDWANAITRGYVNTIKAGLPQGVPPVLPAPGLNPVAPPPFPIGASGFSTADSRSKTMYNVLYAYYYAKEISLDKQAIQELVVDVKRLIIKVKAKTQQVKSLVQRIKNLNNQLSQIPKIIAEIVELLKEEIKARVEDLKNLVASLDEFKIVLGPVDFASVFSEELKILNSVRNFNLLDPASIRELALFVSEYGKRTNTVLAASDDASLMKSYIQSKLFGVAKLFLGFVEGAKDPSQIPNFINALDRDSRRVKLLYQRLNQFDAFVRYVKPKLQRLKIKKDELVSELRVKLQTKLVAVRTKLKKKAEELSRKKAVGKALDLYKKATKIIKDVKQKIKKKTDYYRRKIQLLSRILKTSVIIAGKIAAIVGGLKDEFNQIKQQIIASREALSQTTNTVQSSLTDAQIQVESEALINYFTNLGIGKYANLGVLVLVEAKCDFQTFKTFFERENRTLSQYVQELVSIDNDIKTLEESITELNGQKNAQKKPLKQSPKWKDRIKSLCSFLHLLFSKIEPGIERIKSWVSGKIAEIKAYVKNYLDKTKEDLKIYAINLLPLRSDIQDKKDKKAEAQAKINIIKEKVRQTKKLVELGSNVSKMVKGSLTLLKNLQKGEYRFSTNENAISLVVDGLYAARGYDQSQAVVQSLASEKKETKDRFKSLLIVEALGLGLVEFFKEIKQTNFSVELDKIVNEQKEEFRNMVTFTKVQQIIKNPPSTIQQLINTANTLTLDVAVGVKASTTLLSLERKYLSKSREVVKTLLGIKDLENTKLSKKLKSFQTKLNKNQSFILLGLQMLNEAIKEFLAFVERKVQSFITTQKSKLAAKRAKVQDGSKAQLKKEREKKVNVDAIAMSLAFGLAARAFWTGAQWIGPTGSNHIALSIGIFKRIKAKSTDGASKMIREAAKSFEKQLNLMQGLVIPPPNTGIPPIPFTGYK